MTVKTDAQLVDELMDFNKQIQARLRGRAYLAGGRQAGQQVTRRRLSAEIGRIEKQIAGCQAELMERGYKFSEGRIPPIGWAL